MFQQLINRIAKLSVPEWLGTTFLGGVVGHLANSDNLAAALARMAETAGSGPIWKGALAAGALAVAAKAFANAKVDTSQP
jgi:hypothetical protein